MGDPLSITTSVLALVGVALKVSATAVGMVEKTTGAHEAARDALRNLRRALQNLNKGTSNMQTILGILISDPRDRVVKKLLALPEGDVAIKELCEALESTRGLLAERAGQAQLETAGLEPLPQDRKSLAFVQAVFKHNFSPSNVEDAIIALKDFQFEVESCQQTTELAFQHVWRVYDILNSRTLQRRSSVSTISSISTQILESSTEPQATTNSRRGIMDWLKRQDVASKSKSGTANMATQAGRGIRTGETAEGNTSTSATQPIPTSRDPQPPKKRTRKLFGLSRDRQYAKRMEREADGNQSSSTRTLPAAPIVQSPRTYGHANSNSVQYADYRSGLESHDNLGDGSIDLFEISSSDGISWPRLDLPSRDSPTHQLLAPRSPLLAPPPAPPPLPLIPPPASQDDKKMEREADGNDRRTEPFQSWTPPPQQLTPPYRSISPLGLAPPQAVSTAAQVEAQPDELLSNYDPASPIETTSGDSEHPINDVESLKKGIINVSKNCTRAPYTILLVGETGVGKSSVLELIGNVLSGNTMSRYNFEILDGTNERVGSYNQSKTSSAHLYEFTSKSGIVVRVLDTPGLADIRGIEQDERHMDSIANQIKKHIDSVTAVLILANGTGRITVATDYALSTLSAIFPKSLDDNIAFIFTNVPSALAWNLPQDTVPRVLEGARQFLLDNPIALQKKCLELTLRKARVIRSCLKTQEQRALEMFVDLFDWLDDCKPQPTTEIVHLYEISQDIEAVITETLAQVDEGAAKEVEFDKLTADLKSNSSVVNTSANFEETVNLVVGWKQTCTSTNNMICGQINCYSNCYINYRTDMPLDLRGFFGALCQKCNHSLWNHYLCYSKWEEVIDTRVSVDLKLKEWEAAKDGKAKTAVIIAAREKVSNDLDQVINRPANHLSQLVERYERLALLGSFAAQVKSTIRLLEHDYLARGENNVGHEQLQKVKDSLGHTKRKLVLLNSANTAV